jgi:hypothetical protein
MCMGVTWLVGIGACAPFQSLMRKVVKVPPIKDKYEQVRECGGMCADMQFSPLGCFACQVTTRSDQIRGTHTYVVVPLAMHACSTD